MYLLPRRAAHLTLDVLQSNSFGWRLQDLQQREAELAAAAAGAGQPGQPGAGEGPGAGGGEV